MPSPNLGEAPSVAYLYRGSLWQVFQCVFEMELIFHVVALFSVFHDRIDQQFVLDDIKPPSLLPFIDAVARIFAHSLALTASV